MDGNRQHPGELDPSSAAEAAAAEDVAAAIGLGGFEALIGKPAGGLKALVVAPALVDRAVRRAA